MSLARHVAIQASLHSFVRASGCAGRTQLPGLRRHFTHTTTKARQLPTKRNDNGTRMPRIKHLLHSVERYLETGDEEGEDAALEAFYSKLATSELQGSAKAEAYEKGVLLFFEHECYEGAFHLYDTMTEQGLLPTAALRARILALTMVLNLKKNAELLEGFKKVFAEGLVDQRTLRELLMFMEREGSAKLKFIRDVANLYAESHGPEFRFGPQMSSYLIYVNFSLGVTKDAAKVIEQYSTISMEEKKPLDPAPYTTYLDELLRRKEYAGEDVDAVLQQMDADGVQLDIPVFNVLISSEVRNHRYDKAFMLYQYLLSNRTKELYPDDHTYTALFKALFLLHSPRSALTRRDKRPANMMSPRELFYSMLAAHVSSTSAEGRVRMIRPSGIVTTAVLNAALRTFLIASDHPGAFVVARSFRACGVPLDEKTFRSTLDILTRSIFRSARARPRDPVRRWMNRFLGYPLGPALKADASEAEVLAMIIGISREPRLSLHSADYRLPDFQKEMTAAYERELVSNVAQALQKDDGPRLTIDEARSFQDVFKDIIEPEELKKKDEPQHLPLLASLGEDAPPLPDTSEAAPSLDLTNLERILRRAVLAALPDGAELQAAKSVSAAIAESKREMVPPKPHHSRKAQSADAPADEASQ